MAAVAGKYLIKNENNTFFYTLLFGREIFFILTPPKKRKLNSINGFLICQKTEEPQLKLNSASCSHKIFFQTDTGLDVI